MEGLPVQDARFVVRDGSAVLEPDNPTRVANGDFEEFTGNHVARWGFQDDEGITTFVDTDVKHGGKASLRMENIGRNEHRHCRIMQAIDLAPRVDLVFNSMDNSAGNLYLGSWSGKEGRLWWDDLAVEEIGLVNVLRRPGCPVSIRGETGTVYEEGRDFHPVVDPQLHPWIPYHEPPAIRLTPATCVPTRASGCGATCSIRCTTRSTGTTP